MAKSRKKKPAQKKKPATRSVAMVRAAKKPVAVVVRRSIARRAAPLPAPIITDVATVLKEGEVAIGDLQEVIFTPAQEAILAEPINVADIRWKPSKKNGPKDIPYLPHITYRRWFNRALGRGRWRLEPCGLPMIQNNKLALVPYVMKIFGKRAYFAYGEQDYFENNAQQTYGDVLESTKASAIRRIAKDLGVGLELWDKDFVDGLLRQKGITRQYDEPRGGDYVDLGPARPYNPSPTQQQAPPPRREHPSDVQHGNGDDYVHEHQVTRFWRHIVPNSGRDEAEVRDWLFREWGVQGSAKMKRRDYDAIERAVKSQGPLPTRAR